MNTNYRTKTRRNYTGNTRPGANSPRNNRKKSSIDINLLHQKALPQIPEEEYIASRSFADLPVHKALKEAISNKGYTQPTEIQDRSFDHLFAGRDMLGIAKTGTGKTAAFLIPIIDRLLKNNRNFQTLILVPTRELAVQVEEEFKSLTIGMNLYSSCFIGGTNINRDLHNLRRKSHLVVGTPGRLLDLSQRGPLRFQDFEVLVLDEFDRMLDMGFNKDVHRITDAMKNRRHTLLYSATLDPQQKIFIDRLLNDPVEVKVSNGEVTNEHIEQQILKVGEGEDKFNLLLDLLSEKDCEKALVFAETKRWVSKVNKKLRQGGVSSDEIHGNKSQNYRQSALNRFKDGQIKVLVATDVAARGLDVSDITHVINFQLPGSLDSYIHRIGRTGRAGKSGKAFTFIN